MNGKPFSCEEKDYLTSNSGKYTVSYFAEKLGRSNSAIYKQCQKLGVRLLNGSKLRKGFSLNMNEAERIAFCGKW